MVAKHPGKKFLKISAVIAGIVLLLLTTFHLWFINHAKGLLENMVAEQSGGKLKLKVGKLRYNYFNHQMRIYDASFFSVDTATNTTSYQFNAKKIHVKLQALLPFILQKKLLINSLVVDAPDITVTRLRYIENTAQKNNKDVSVPFEMGKIYKSIQEALQELQVEKFHLTNGKFSLRNKADTDQSAVVISNIDFHIENLKVSSENNRAKEKILFSDNVILNTHHQDITFPDGRHRLSFARFSINLQDQLVEFDSCTISGAKTDSSNASFSVFFDKLRLANVDFDTLYKAEVIKADTVFCLSPRFTLVADITKKKDSSAGGPKLEKIIQQLTGDLLLANVIVNNASFDILTTKNGIPSSFTSEENNFEMQGLKINQDAYKPISVETFRMAIRNYENFIKDSSYRVQFDSILFRDNRIYLSNFLFNTLKDGKTTNTFRIPQFYLGGLSWDDLVFEKKLRAEQATLFNPYIKYDLSAITGSQKGNKDIFSSLAAINNYMNLDYLDIQNGEINLTRGKDFRMQLRNATLSIKSSALLTSTELAGIKNSLTNLNFENGTIHAGNMDIALKNIHYLNKNGQLTTDRISIKTADNDFSFAGQNTSIEKLQVDEKTGNILAEGITWKTGDLSINPDKAVSGGFRSSLSLKNLNGLNTQINITGTKNNISTTLSKISFDKLERKPGQKPEIENLFANGQQLIFHKDDIDLTSDSYTIADNKSSSFSNFSFQKNNNSTVAIIGSPSVLFIPHIKSFIDESPEFDLVSMDKPVINIQLTNIKPGSINNEKILSAINIKSIKLDQPEIVFNRATDSGIVSLNWQGQANNTDFLHIQGFHISNDSFFNTSFSNAQLAISNFIYKGPGGKEFNSADGEFAADLKDISAKKQTNQEWEWQGWVNNLEGKNVLLDSTGKQKGRLLLDRFNIKNLSVSSSYADNIKKLIRNNSTTNFLHVTGSYRDSTTNLTWQNASFDKSNGSFSLDSFSYSPGKDRETFIASQPYQTDYINFHSGKIAVTGFNTDGYLKDDILKIKTIDIDNAFLKDFRDTRIPRKPGEIKLLPVALIKKIPPNTFIEKINFSNGRVIYAELNSKTDKTGTIPITRMHVSFSPVKNFNLAGTDSLFIEARGYLMDSILTQLSFHQSYTDSAGSFILRGDMAPVNATIMNPVLIPLASAKLKSGYLDSLEMWATGNEYIATGTMKMFYHDLKIAVLPNGDEEKKTLKTRLANFIVNTFLVKNKNISKTSAIFFERLRGRSVLNYIVKMFTSGISSSTGIKNSKKMRKEYNKALKKY